MSLTKSYLDIFILGLIVKLLLIPAYHSTDFEVHRNWLRITKHLPIDQWYFDTQSEWTLDYPPLFAYLEYFLSQLSQFIDKDIAGFKFDYKALTCVYYQRITVIVLEFIFYYAVHRFVKTFYTQKHQQQYQYHLILLVFLQMGFILVDNIHFQYNTFMQGILLLAILYGINKQFLMCGLLFSIVLNFKHIFLYYAFSFFLYILKFYVLQKRVANSLKNLIKMGLTVLSVFLISFTPFLGKEQILQIASRLFPFQRGLVHKLWAANFWALYCSFDKVLSFVGRTFLKYDIQKQATSSSGIVQETKFDVLPTVSSFTTIVIILVISIPFWIKLLRDKKEKNFLYHCAIQALIFFMFGFHVHEKAILLSLSLFQILSLHDSSLCHKTFLMSLGGNLAIFPLFPELQESILIGILYVTYHLTYYIIIKSYWQKSSHLNNQQYHGFNLIEKLFLVLVVLIFIAYFLLTFYFKGQIFLVIMLNSNLSALINLYYLICLLFK